MPIRVNVVVRRESFSFCVKAMTNYSIGGYPLSRVLAPFLSPPLYIGTAPTSRHDMQNGFIFRLRVFYQAKFPRP